MINKELQQEIERILPAEQIRYDEPMAGHCSFRTGGPADALVSVRTGGELSALLALVIVDFSLSDASDSQEE